MKKTEEELVISVRNRVRQNVEIPEGQLPRSTKREPGHGMGLANVCAVVEAHNAEYTLSCRDNWFRFTCAFPTNGIGHPEMQNMTTPVQWRHKSAMIKAVKAA